MIVDIWMVESNNATEYLWLSGDQRVYLLGLLDVDVWLAETNKQLSFVTTLTPRVQLVYWVRHLNATQFECNLQLSW